jgi:endonuclease/exonuclease/phosphatase family metal-dependent hydrolase
VVIAGLTVMSFNIRYATAQDFGNRWDNRRGSVVDCIRRIGPDLLGLQECRLDGQIQDVMNDLQEYGWFGEPRGGESDSALEMTPVLYRRDRFQAIDNGNFWLSKSPTVSGSRSWGAWLPRTLTWVRLRDGERRLLFANTHFDHFSGKAREKSAEMVKTWTRSRSEDEACILTGDFNASKESEPYRILTGVLPDPFRDPRLGERPAEGSFHGYGLLNPPAPIDWVLASPELIPQQAWVEDGRAEGGWLSDHHPVVVEFL